MKRLNLPKPSEVPGTHLIQPIDLWDEPGWNVGTRLILEKKLNVIVTKRGNILFETFQPSKVEMFKSRPMNPKTGKPCLCKECMDVHKNKKHMSETTVIQTF